MSNLFVGPFAADVEKLALACVFVSVFGRIYAGGRPNIEMPTYRYFGCHFVFR